MVQDEFKFQNESMAQSTYATMFVWAVYASICSLGEKKKIKMNQTLLDLSVLTPVRRTLEFNQAHFKSTCTTPSQRP